MRKTARRAVSLLVILAVIFTLVLSLTTSVSAFDEIRIGYRCDNPASPTTYIKASFKVYNNTTLTKNMSDVKIRYWYTKDTVNFGVQRASCTYAAFGTANVTTTIYEMGTPPGLTGADCYVEIGFTAGAGVVPPMGSSGDFTIYINKIDGTNFIQTNDYSCAPGYPPFNPFNNVTGYLGYIHAHGTPPANIGSFLLSYRSDNVASPTNTIAASFQIFNNGNFPLRLQDIKIRYWYTAEVPEAQVFQCIGSTVGIPNVTGVINKENLAADRTNNIVEIGFTPGAGNINPGQTVALGITVRGIGGGLYDQMNDYSFTNTMGAYIQFDRVTGYLDGVRETGIEPVLF